MALLDTIKNWFKKDTAKEKPAEIEFVSIASMEKKFAEEDLVGAAKELKQLLEYYANRKKKNHRTKGREFIYFILSNKHKDLKNVGYNHWQNITDLIQKNPPKVYPYHQNNLRAAMTFFENEIKELYKFSLLPQ